jgi:hypothetical protein
VQVSAIAMGLNIKNKATSQKTKIKTAQNSRLLKLKIKLLIYSQLSPKI